MIDRKWWVSSLTDRTSSPPGGGGGSGGGARVGTLFDPWFRKHRPTHNLYRLRKQPFETHLLTAPSGTMEDTSEGRERSENDQKDSDRRPRPDSADEK